MSPRPRPLALAPSHLVVIALALGTAGCPSGSSEAVDPEGPDEPGDDDDALVDDPSCGFDEVTMTAEFEVRTVTEGDVDRLLVTGRYGFHYWEDIREGVPLCDQTLTFEAEAWFGEDAVIGRPGAPDCVRCGGYLKLDPASVRDVTDPESDPDACTAADLKVAVNDWGRLLTTPVSPTTHGDFLNMAMLDAATQEAFGVDLQLDEDATSASALRTKWADEGFVYTHAGYVHAYQGSLAITACTFLLSATPEPDSAYLSAWEIYRSEEEIRPDSADGRYHGIAFFSSPY